jgi:hypothetical protein
MTPLWYLAALGLTEALEAPVYAPLLAKLEGVRPERALAASGTVNLVSHPLFSFVLLAVALQLVHPLPALLAGEAVVVAVETALLYAWLRRDLLLLAAVALLANALSFAVGLLVL